MRLQIFVLDRVVEEDGVTGDAYGPYEKEQVAKERERVAREKVLPPSPRPEKPCPAAESTHASVHCSVDVSTWLRCLAVNSPAKADGQQWTAFCAMM